MNVVKAQLVAIEVEEPERGTKAAKGAARRPPLHLHADPEVVNSEAVMAPFVALRLRAMHAKLQATSVVITGATPT